MARTLGKKVVICGDYDATTGKPIGEFHEILLDDHEPMPQTVAHVEALVETSKVAAQDKDKCRTLVSAIKVKAAEGVAAEATAAEAAKEE